LHIDRIQSNNSKLLFQPQTTWIKKFPLMELPLNKNWINELKIGGNYIRPYFRVFAANSNEQQNDYGEYLLIGLGIAAIVGIVLAIDDISSMLVGAVIGGTREFTLRGHAYIPIVVPLGYEDRAIIEAARLRACHHPDEYRSK